MSNKDKILTKDLRTELKTMVQKELKQMPELLKKLDSKERLNVLCRLLPYVMPKVEQIRHDNNEPIGWSL
jgi:hypothetical protein